MGYPLVFALFSSAMLFYLINYAITPYGEDNVVDIKNILIVSIVLLVTIASFFSFFHLLIDKLFFRKFYESPRLFPAIRRGVLFGLFIAGLGWIRIFDFWLPHVILLVLALVVLIEALFISLSPHRGEKGKKVEPKDPVLPL
jgi:hypothetical protein